MSALPNDNLSQTGRVIEKFPRHAELLRQLGGERFHPKVSVA